MPVSLARAGLALLCALVLFGCNPSGEGEPKPPDQGTDPSQPSDQPSRPPLSTKATDEPQVTLNNTTIEALMQTIEQYKGKVVLVDLWANWCVPCKKKFPHVVELAKTRAEDGLQVISVSLDALSYDLPEARSNSLEFLTQQQATFPNFLMTSNTDDLNAWEDKFPTGALPIYHIYDRQGKRIQTFGNGKPFSAQELDQVIDQLLKAK